MKVSATTKAELLDLIGQERERWEALLDRVGIGRMSQPGQIGDWSIKDLVAHVTDWRDYEVARIEAASCSGTPAPPPWPPSDDVDEINAWIYEHNRDRTLGDVLRESRASFDRLEAAVRAVAEPDLFAPNRFPWMKGKPIGPTVVQDALGHFPDEHESTLREWLAEQDDQAQTTS